MRKVETYGTIDNGILKISKRDLFDQNIRLIGSCRVKVTVEKLYKRRSTKTYDEDTGEEGRGQNGYYFHIVCEKFRQGWQDMTGQLITKKQAHEYLKFYCNFEERLNENTGEILHIPLTTTTQTTVEAEEYYQRYREWIFDNMNIEVPLPNEKLELPLNYQNTQP